MFICFNKLLKKILIGGEIHCGFHGFRKNDKNFRKIFAKTTKNYAMKFYD